MDYDAPKAAREKYLTERIADLEDTVSRLDRSLNRAWNLINQIFGPQLERDEP